jgi:mycothiol synthase
VSAYAQRSGDTVEVVGYFSDFPGMPNFGAVALHSVSAGEDVLVWSHGKRSPLEHFLREEEFVPVRTLHQMRLRLSEQIEVGATPPGVTLRGFVPGQDEDEFLRVNAAAFSEHSEQGSWTRADIEAREAEAWFDPEGLILAERTGGPSGSEGVAAGGRVLLGFHFTKRHADGHGEVYVIGVDPAAQGTGLGAHLLAAGLRRLQEQGVGVVSLYVDDDNTTARGLYLRKGFVDVDRDVQWRRSVFLVNR